MRKRFYIMLVARDAEGQLLKIPIPLHYLYVFLAGALIGMLTITGMAGSYTRMLLKVARFNKLRTEKQALNTQYHQLEQAAKVKDMQVASLGNLAGEVSALYGLKSDAVLMAAHFNDDDYNSSLNQLYALRDTAMSGAASIGIGWGQGRAATLADWVRLADAPTLWPIQGRVTSSFGERLDPFDGEGAFHTGVDIAGEAGEVIIAPANGVVRAADRIGGYGRAILIDHGHGISTLYGHLSAFAVAAGQAVQRGEIIGYVGDSGRSTGPHLHYEVRVNDVPVNPYHFLRNTIAQEMVSAEMEPGQ